MHGGHDIKASHNDYETILPLLNQDVGQANVMANDTMLVDNLELPSS